MRWARGIVALALLAVACSDDGDSERDPETFEGTSVLFDLDADLSDEGEFFHQPFPSDLRLRETGTPDLSGFPGRSNAAVGGLVPVAEEREGFSTITAAYFQFDAALAVLALSEPIAGTPDAPLVLIDVDPGSPERGALHPVVATVVPADRYAPENLLAVAPMPGIVLHGDRTYAFLVMRELGDAAGARLGVPLRMREILRGTSASDAARATFAPLGAALDIAGIRLSEVAAATVFTTGDVVLRTESLSADIVEKHDVSIDGLAIDPSDGASHERFCELRGTIDFPQFQTGMPPFSTEGRFEFGADGSLVEQRRESADFVITLPKAPMPAVGYPLVVYLHGSGGTPDQVVDRGHVATSDGLPVPGTGPAQALSAHGFATVSTSMPVNPQRSPGSGEYGYLNFSNLGAFPYLFRQGVFEQRLLFEALERLEIPASALTSCSGPTLPSGETAYRVDAKSIHLMGQSMGGMYTSLVAAVEPRVRAVAPTGAGGFWSHFVFDTKLIPTLPFIAANLLETEEAALSHVHPALMLLQTAWEPAEPIVSVPRLAARPLPGHPVRPIYEPIGFDDIYFQPATYDAFVVASGNQLAGERIWTTTEERLAFVGRARVASYPVRDNLESEAGTRYTGAAVQFAGDGILDAHYIFDQLDAVKRQYSCFFATFREAGAAVVVAPGSPDEPCE